MNLYWIVGLAIYVLLEKWAAHGLLLSRAAGVLVIGLGVAMIYTAVPQ